MFPPQRLTFTAPTFKVMAGIRRRTTTSRSATSQAPWSTIQILQSQTVSIIELVNPKGSDDILDTKTGVHATTALNAMVLPPPARKRGMFRRWSLRISKNLNRTNTGQHLWRWNSLPQRQWTSRGKERSFPRIRTKGVAKHVHVVRSDTSLQNSVKKGLSPTPRPSKGRRIHFGALS